jgi:hypothetical protein
MRFEHESSNDLDDEFLILLTFDPSGVVRVTTLGKRLGAQPYRGCCLP